MVDKIETATIITSITGTVIGAITIISGYPVLTAVIAATIGSAITITFNSWLQKRAWKREVTIKKMNEIYGPLYLDIGNALEKFTPDNLGWGWYRSEEWPKMQAHYHYRLLRSTDQNLVDELNVFYNIVDKVGEMSSAVRELADKALINQVKAKMGADIYSVSWEFEGFREGVSRGKFSSFSALKTVITAVDPLAEMQTSRSEETIEARIGVSRLTSREVPYQQISLDVVREIFGKATDDLSKREELRALKEETEKLKKLGGELREKLGKIIEEPWK